jgi:hypothetical protein
VKNWFQAFAFHKCNFLYRYIEVLSKAEVIRTRQVEHIKAERHILDKVNHPFIVKLLGSSQAGLYQLNPVEPKLV